MIRTMSRRSPRARYIRSWLPAALLIPIAGAACGGDDLEENVEAPLRQEREEVVERSAVEHALLETIRRAGEHAAAIEDSLRPVPLMRPAEESALRQYLNASHLVRARALGVRATDTDRVEDLLAEGRLIQLEDSSRHWIVREEGGSPAYVVPHTRELLHELGERFQDRLAEMGLPPYRLEVTSALRTTARQAALRQRNPNAAAGVSTHEFGTTVDIAYSAYAPPAELPADLLIDTEEWLVPYLDHIVRINLESVSARKSRELKAILGQVLRQAQSDGIVLVTLERLQPVYHVTVAEALADETGET